MIDKIPQTQFNFRKEYIKREDRSHRYHVIRRACTESRWPYTGDLTPQEIICMRDTYCGPRMKPSFVQRRSDYDRLYHPVVGWEQKCPRDTRHHLRAIQCSVRDEDMIRKVPVEINCTYGTRLSQFVDIASNNHPRQHTCKRQFIRHNPILSLPPLRDLEVRLPHPDQILKSKLG